MLSCAFDNTCVGLVMQRNQSDGGALWKIASFGDRRWEAYVLGEDLYEETNRWGELPEAERVRSRYLMRAWTSAVRDFWFL